MDLEDEEEENNATTNQESSDPLVEDVDICMRFKGNGKIGLSFRKDGNKIPNIKKKILRCSICPYSSAYNNLSKHILRNHLTKNPTADSNFYRCHICNESFKHDTELSQHLDNHNDSLKCTHCNVKFIGLRQLQLHKIKCGSAR